MNIKKLGLDDYYLLKNFFKSDDSAEKALKNYYLKGEKYSIFGLFDEKDLIEFVGVIESEEIPAWILSKHFSYLRNNSRKLVDYILETEESKNRYQFFTLDDSLEIPERYNRYLEHVVPKETFTGFENIDHDVLEYRKSNTDRCIYLWVIKNEYRSF